MKKTTLFILIVLALTTSCASNNDAIIPATLVPLKDIQLNEDVFSGVDLGLVAGETIDNYPDTWVTRGVSLGDNNFIQRFYNTERSPVGFVAISLFEDMETLSSVYELASTNAKGALRSSPATIGDDSIEFEDGAYKGLIISRCHAFIIIFLKDISLDFIKFFAQDLIKNIDVFSCR